MPRGGSQRVTADGVIGISGQAIRLYGASITSGATGGVVNFRNGTAVTDTILFSASGTANLTVLVANIPAEGVYFPDGLYVDVDANATAVVCSYEQVIAR